MMKTKVIEASDFIRHWQLFSDKITSNNDWVKKWQTGASWSKYLLGTKSSTPDCSPIGNHFRKEYPGLRYRTEDGLFDLTMTLHPNFGNIPTLKGNYQPDHFNVDNNCYYPTIYDILIEHENEIYRSWHEVAKLTYVRGLLKVLITYHSDNLSEDQRQAERNMMTDTFTTIIEQSSQGFTDYQDTEYLLLLGYKAEKRLHWTANVFDFKMVP